MEGTEQERVVEPLKAVRAISRADTGRPEKSGQQEGIDSNAKVHEWLPVTHTSLPPTPSPPTNQTPRALSIPTGIMEKALCSPFPKAYLPGSPSTLVVCRFFSVLTGPMSLGRISLSKEDYY